MSLDNRVWLDQLDDYPEVADCIRQSSDPHDALPSYEYLYKFKGKIPKELYAHYLRTLLQFNTANVSVEMRLKMLEDVDRNDIMFQKELEAIRGFGETITVFRGTSKEEELPSLSWSLKRYIAESSDFYRGRLFKATIPTSKILLYLSQEEDEEEIIAHITSNSEIEDC